MAINQKKEKIVSVRMTEDDYKLLRFSSKSIGVTPSKFLRMTCDSVILAVRLKINQGVLSYDDIETLLNDKL